MHWWFKLHEQGYTCTVTEFLDDDDEEFVKFLKIFIEINRIIVVCQESVGTSLHHKLLDIGLFRLFAFLVFLASVLQICWLINFYVSLDIMLTH